MNGGEGVDVAVVGRDGPTGAVGLAGPGGAAALGRGVGDTGLKLLATGLLRAELGRRPVIILDLLGVSEPATER